MIELDLALYSALSGDAALVALAIDGIHKGVNKQTEATRYVTYQVVTGTPDYTLTLESNRSIRVQLKTWDRDLTWDACNQMADRIEAVIVKANLSIAGWTLKDVKLLDRHDSSEEHNNILYPYTYLEHRLDMQKDG